MYAEGAPHTIIAFTPGHTGADILSPALQVDHDVLNAELSPSKAPQQ